MVGLEPCSPPPAPPPRCRQRFPSLAEAVAASRPGDTILLEPTPPGRPHAAAGVAIAHPLRLLGDGDAPGDCVLRCAARGVPALAVAASARLFNLCVQGDGLAGAVVHTGGGRLKLEHCELSCAARGLPHLAAPLVCMAAPRRGASACGAACGGGAAPLQAPLATSTPLGRNRGVTVVAGCTLEGGGSAVRCGVGVTLQDVRVAYETHRAMFWFEVAAHPVEGEDGGAGEARGGGTAAAAAASAGPSWLSRRRGQGFDPGALQAQVDAMGERPAGAQDLEKKAQAWRAGHRAPTADVT